MTYPIDLDPRHDAYMNRGTFIVDGFFSFKDDGIDECIMFCGDEHDIVIGKGNTLRSLLAGDGPFIEEAEYYLRTGGVAP